MRSARATGGRGTRRRGARARRRRGRRYRSPVPPLTGGSSPVDVQQAIADAADGLNQVRAPELLAQLCDVDVDGARPAGEREPPDAIEEKVSPHDTAGVPRELGEQIEF